MIFFLNLPLLLFFFIRNGLCSAQGKYEVLRMVPKTQEQFQYLAELYSFSTDDGLDFWVAPSAVNKTVDIMVPPKLKDTAETLFRTKNLEFMRLIPDVEKAINEIEESDARHAARRRKRRIGYGFDFDRYNDYYRIMSYLHNVVHMNPEITDLKHIGWSHEGRNLYVLKVGKPGGYNKPGIWIDGGIHAREWPSPHTAIYFIQQLVTNYGKDPEVTFMVDNMNWYIAPMINPDGYMFSRSSKDPQVRLWRKNRSPKKCYRDTRFRQSYRENCCSGVDLNRNFDHYFQGRGTDDYQYYRASRNACSSNYAGEGPFSEPESKAMSKFIQDPRNNIQAFVSLHTYGQIVIHPYGHKRGYYPPDIQELREVGTDAMHALGKMHHTTYKLGSTADMLYLASGTAVDWVKSQAGVKYTFLLEMRPDRDTITDVMTGTGGFLMQERYLMPIAEETWEAVKVIGRAVLKYNGFHPPQN